VGTADGSSASWTVLSPQTMGCPRNRVNSNAFRNEEMVSGVTRSEQYAAHDREPVRLRFRNDDVQEAEATGIER
jgi:hypothetical protein